MPEDSWMPIGTGLMGGLILTLFAVSLDLAIGCWQDRREQRRKATTLFRRSS